MIDSISLSIDSEPVTETADSDILLFKLVSRISSRKRRSRSNNKREQILKIETYIAISLRELQQHKTHFKTENTTTQSKLEISQ